MVSKDLCLKHTVVGVRYFSDIVNINGVCYPMCFNVNYEPWGLAICENHKKNRIKVCFSRLFIYLIHVLCHTKAFLKPKIKLHVFKDNLQFGN